MAPAKTEMSAIFNQLKTAPLYASMEASTGGYFYGRQGSRFVFAPNSFQTVDGVIVTGKVQLTVKELLSKSDMLFNNAYTVSGSDLLISGGEIFVEATQNEKPVFLRPGYTYLVNMPQDVYTDFGYEAFDRNYKHTSNTQTAEYLDWASNSGGTARVEYADDSVMLISKKPGWCAASKRYIPEQPRNFTVLANADVQGTALAKSSELYGFCVLKDHKGVWPLGQNGLLSDSKINVDNVPGVPQYFVIFGLIEDKFYGGIKPAIPVNGESYTVWLTRNAPSAFKSLVDRL